MVNVLIWTVSSDDVHSSGSLPRYIAQPDEDYRNSIRQSATMAVGSVNLSTPGVAVYLQHLCSLLRRCRQWWTIRWTRYANRRCHHHHHHVNDSASATHLATRAQNVFPRGTLTVHWAQRRFIRPRACRARQQRPRAVSNRKATVSAFLRRTQWNPYHMNRWITIHGLAIGFTACRVHRSPTAGATFAIIKYSTLMTSYLVAALGLNQNRTSNASSNTLKLQKQSDSIEAMPKLNLGVYVGLYGSKFES